MTRLHCLIFVLLFLEFRTDLVSAERTTENISAIIQSYADAFTTVKPEESQFVTTRIQPKIEVNNPGYVYDFKKAKYESRPPIYENSPLVAAGSSPEYMSADDYSSSSSVEESDESEDPKGPADHVIPFSEHENPKEPSTHPNYTAPGDWAKPPADKNIPLEFVPSKLYAQVRGSHTVKHLPQEEAVKSAETSEEKENAARLKEVVKESKANTVYTEEGYEDAAYDHAGQIRDADFHEDFKHKLNEELNSKGSYSGKKKKPKTYKKHKPRKYRQNDHDDFAENYKSHSEVAQEARMSKQQVNPKQVNILKNALNQPAIDPKFTVENGIAELEKDLREESLEKQRTSTEPYTYITTTIPTIYKLPATESVFQSKMDPETTTIRRSVFTIRPKKSFVTPRPKVYYKPKKPLNAFSVSKNNDNYNAYSTSSYSFEPTTIDYGNVAWSYLLQNQNATPALTYSPPYIEQQTVNPVIANPLAVATLNGHGPYLVVVTEPTDTLTQNPLESQNFESTIDYGLGVDYNLTKPSIGNSYGYHNPFIPVHRKANELNYKNDPHSMYTSADVSNVLQNPYSVYTNADVSNKLQNPHRIYTNADSTENYKRREMKRRENIPKLKKLKAQPLLEADPNFIEKAKDNYMQYYTPILPLKTSNLPIKYPHYKRKPFANAFDQWPETDESGKLVESNRSNGIERPPIEPVAQKSVSKPVTKLLPPSPLSTSEYATFHRQSRGIKPMPSPVMAMMPIIDAIHKHEHEQTSFPFLLRRKRSTFGFFRTPNFKPRDRRQQGTDSNEKLSQSSSDESKNTKYPGNFNVLLNESPQVATKVVDDEIKGRFGKNSKTLSDESSKELAKIELNQNAKTSLGSEENSKEVEVEVPELDFGGVFEKDEVEPTTKKPGTNTKKYPFYKDSSVLRNSALKYVVNPKQVPKKTLGGMEFYNSRIRECEEVEPNLEKIVPEDEELVNKRGPQKKKLRLHGLGDKIDCYKAKYFDENPLDNPLFLEEKVEMPTAPVELNPKKFASRILELPDEKDDYTIPRGPKNPEFTHVQRSVKLRRPLRPHVSENNVRYHLHPKSRKPNLVSYNQQRYRYPTKYPENIQDKIRPQAARPKTKIKTSNGKVVPRYQRLVYEDVMGNIMNLEKVQKPRVPKRGVAPFYSKHYKRDNNREQGIPGSKKMKNTAIDGLVPPPKKLSDKLVYANSNLQYNRKRYNSSDLLTKNLRIYKRSITLDVNKNLSSSETEDDVTENGKPTFRIVFTTPLPNPISSRKQTVNSEEVDFSAQNESNTVTESPKNLNPTPLFAQISSEKKTLNSEEVEEFSVQNESNAATKRPKHPDPTPLSAQLSSEKQTLNSEEVDEFSAQNKFNTVTERPKDSNQSLLSAKISSKKQTLHLEEMKKFTTQKAPNTVKESPKHPNRSEVDPGRYDKFSLHENTNTFSETRRKEPKYSVAKKRRLANQTLKLARDTSVASSTFVPVMVHLYDNFTARIPRGSINNHAKQQLVGKPVHNKRIEKYEVSTEEIEPSIEQVIEQEDPKKQFVTFSPVQEKNKDKPNVTETTYISTPNIEEHKELFQFLKGNPPGYEEAFSEESDSESIEDKPKELLNDEDENLNAKILPKNEEIQVETGKSPKNEDTDDETSESEAEEPDQDEEKKEVYEEEGTSEDSPEQVEENGHSPEQAEENGQSGGDEKSSKDDKHDDEPFVRFSSRPYSPPENYEDDRYADLGPRINKPYFYHPPFDVPTYEKYELGKPVGHSDDEYGHEETDNHEKYVFPWENDDEDDEKKEESEHLSESDRPEYPWEKRERQNKERQKREKVRKNYNKKKYDIDDHGKEASNTKYVYVPSKNKHLRGKKDVHAAQGNLYNYPSKYSSKYKSAKIKDIDVDDDDDDDDIEKSILKYIENLESTTPIDENIETTPRQNIKDVAKDEIVTSNPLSNTNDTLVMSSNKQESSTTFSLKPGKSDRINSTAVSSTNRGRGRSPRIITNSNKQNDSITTTANINHLKVQPTASPKVNRQRGRNRGTTISLTTTTTTAKPNARRRTRLTSSTTSTSTTTTTPRTIPKIVNERRKRPFRVISYTNSRVGSTTPSTLPTSTGRTVEREHRSRVSKEMIITKTVEDNDDDDEDSDKTRSNQDNNKSPSIVAQVRRSKVRHQHRTKNTTDDNNPSKKERVEKVTITMEETPDHVYKTKEIDKDGIKGKFVTITANNNSANSEPAKRTRDRTTGSDDAEMEEIKRRMDAFKSFDSVIQDTEDLADEPSSLRTAEKYVVGSLLQKLPLPLARQSAENKEGNNTVKNRNNENEDEEESEDEEEAEDDDDDDDNDDEEETDEREDKDANEEDLRDRKNDGQYGNNNTNSTDENPSVIKNPDNRNYYYVEAR